MPALSLKHRLFHLTKVIFFTAVLLLAACSTPAEQIPATHPLVRLFQEAGGQMEELRLVGWTTLKGPAVTLAELQSQALAAGQVLETPLLLTRVQDLPQWREVTYESQDGQRHIQVIGQATGEEAYLLLRVAAPGSDDLNLWEQKLRQALGDRCEINVLARGPLSGAPDQEETARRLAEALAAVGARTLETAGEDRFYSVSAYLEGDFPQVQAGNDIINLQLGVSFRPQEGQTILYAGIPLIYTDF